MRRIAGQLKTRLFEHVSGRRWAAAWLLVVAEGMSPHAADLKHKCRRSKFCGRQI